MEYKYKEADTETWIMLFLHKNGSSTIMDMTKRGCKIMTFGIKYEKFLSIIEDMEKNDFIVDDTPIHNEYEPTPPTSYSLNAKGLFHINQNVLFPITTLDNEQLKTLIPISKSICDTAFVKILSSGGTETDKEQHILNFALRHLPEILGLVTLINGMFV